MTNPFVLCSLPFGLGLRPSRLRLLIAAVLFMGWIAWLVYLAVVSRDYVVLSRPQFLVANVHVLARLTGKEMPQPLAAIQEVLWSADPADRHYQGKEIQVARLDQCGLEQGWGGTGTYLLPLMKAADGTFLLAPTPSSPGYAPRHLQDRLRIYPATPEVLRQLRDLH